MRSLVIVIILLAPLFLVEASKFEVSGSGRFNVQGSGRFNVLSDVVVNNNTSLFDYIEYGTLIMLSTVTSSTSPALSNTYTDGQRSIVYLGQNGSSWGDNANDVFSNLKWASSNTIITTRLDSSNAVGNNFAAVQWKSDVIQSIQEFDVRVFGTSPVTQAISSVNASNTVVHVYGNTSTSTSTAIPSRMGTATLNSGTQFTVERAGSDGSTTSVQVIEFKPGIANSIQSVNVTIPSGSSISDATINSVNVGQTLLFYRGMRTDSTAVSSNNCYGSLINSTTVQARRSGTTNSCTIAVDVVEFNPTYTVTATTSIKNMSGVSTIDETISAVTLAKTLLTYLGTASPGSTYTSAKTRIILNSTTNINFLRSSAASSATTSYSYLQSN